MLVSYICYNTDELPNSTPSNIIESFENRPDNESGMLVIEHNGNIIGYFFDHGEQEDNYFFRDYSWVDEWINKAYELGRVDERNEMLEIYKDF